MRALVVADDLERETVAPVLSGTATEFVRIGDSAAVRAGQAWALAADGVNSTSSRSMVTKMWLGR